MKLSSSLIVVLIINIHEIMSFQFNYKYHIPIYSINYKHRKFSTKSDNIITPITNDSRSTLEGDSIFGAEFQASKNTNPENYNFNSNKAETSASPEIKEKAMEGFNKLRSTFLADSLLVSSLGLSLVWYFGTYKDSISFALGAFLGIAYSILLGKYVERIGTSKKSKLADSLRFGPVVLLIALYGKFRSDISIIAELLGYFTSYQLGSFLQIFNQSLYDIEDEDTIE